MGCGVSKIDTSGATALPVKLRPVFLRRLEEIKNRRHSQPLKDSTPSKKELLLHDIDEEDNVSHFSSSEYDTSKNVPSPTKDGTNPSKNESLPTRNSTNSVGRFESSKGKDPTKPVKKEAKRGRKIQSFRKVLPKGGQSTVMNLLNVKSCYNSSHSARDRAHLLTAKTV